jgi:hypothetical protein
MSVKLGFVYRLVSITTGHYYIGATGTPYRRLKQHLKQITRGNHNTLFRHLTYDHPELKHPGYWEMQILEKFNTVDEAGQYESYLLLGEVGQPLCLNMRRSSPFEGGLTADARERTGRTNAVSLRGVLKSAAHKDAISQALKGRPPNSAGKPISEASRKRRSEALKAYWARKKAGQPTQ